MKTLTTSPGETILLTEHGHFEVKKLALTGEFKRSAERMSAVATELNWRVYNSENAKTAPPIRERAMGHGRLKLSALSLFLLSCIHTSDNRIVVLTMEDLLDGVAENLRGAGIVLIMQVAANAVSVDGG